MDLVLDAVVLKYSLNLEADPDVAAVAALLANVTACRNAVERAELYALLLQASSRVLLSRGLTAFSTLAAAAPSTVMVIRLLS